MSNARRHAGGVWRRRAIGTVFLLLQVLAGAAWAETVTLTPPYAESSTYRNCSAVLVGCVAEATADPATGELSFEVAAASADVVWGTGQAKGTIVATHTLDAESNAIGYIVNVHITQLLMEDTPRGGIAEAWLTAYAYHPDCSGCGGPWFNREDIYWLGNNSVVENEASLAIKLTNLDGGPVPQGTIQIVVVFGASAQVACSFNCGGLDVQAGEASASGRATVTSIVATWNNNPVAADDSASSRAGFSVRINVLANDSDRDGDPLTVIGVSDPPNGSAVINADNTVTYDPDGCFVGTDSFAYTISDGKDGTDTGTVSVQLRKTSRRSSIGC